MQKAVTKKMHFQKKSPGNLLNTLYQPSNFGAPSCNGSWDIKFSMSTFAKGNNSNKIKWFKKNTR